MLRFGTVLVFAGMTMATAVMAAEGPAQPAAQPAFEIGATACTAAGIGAPTPILTANCIQCRIYNLTGSTQSASDVNCSAATSDLQTALFHAATLDCQNRGYDWVCSGSLVVHITSACSASGSVFTVGGYGTYGCALNVC
jgi:hypothetical protein